MLALSDECDPVFEEGDRAIRCKNCRTVKGKWSPSPWQLAPPSLDHLWFICKNERCKGRWRRFIIADPEELKQAA